MRNPDRLPEQWRSHQNVQLIVGDAQNAEKVKATIEGSNHVIVSLGGEINGKVCSQGQKVINDAINEVNPDLRVVTVTSLGCGDSYAKLSFITKQFVDWVIWNAIQDKNIQEASIAADLKNWVVVRPGGLTDGEQTQKINAGFEISGGRISRADVAYFILEECLAEETKWKNKNVTLVAESSGWF